MSQQQQRTLASLLQGVDFQIIPSRAAVEFADLPVSTLVSDSRLASPGALFVALAGVANDGHDFLEMAAVNGCPVLLCQSGRVPRERLAKLHVLVIETPDTKEAYAAIAANFFQRPTETLTCIGVTGTNGKTTTTYLLEHIFLKNGWNVGVIGTVNNRYTLQDGKRKVLDTRFTTPEAFILQQVLREMADAGVDHVIMEVSSHALEQARIGGIVFQAAAFTNLTRDHLDYHPDMAAYLQAKTKLFSRYLHSRGTAVLPAPREGDDNWEWLRPLHNLCRQAGNRVISWGEGNDRADIRLRKYHSRLDCTELEIETAGGIHTLVSPLVGRFNVENILTVFGLCLAMDIDYRTIGKALATAVGAPGRLERVAVAPSWNSGGPVVFVDYAHTPDALEKVLATVKALPHRELLCVFGCGGDRDNGKRPLMGAIASKLADVAVITDDNPRTEDPDRIITQILAGTGSAGAEVHSREWLQVRLQGQAGAVVIRDRKQAIEAVIKAAGPEDIVVIAGKGHETYQLTLQGKRFFDDRLEARNSLLAWTDELVAQATGGVLQPGSRNRGLYGPVFIDSRKAGNGGVFVALKGDNHDAHDYLGQAVANGAACLVVEHVPPAVAASAASRVVVADTQRALGDMAAYRRRRLAQLYSQIIIGITGSCGKTTVKEMVTAILARKWPAGADYHGECVLKTQGNFNNLIGLPLSLLPLSTNHRAAVLEMGMNRPGELLRLGEIADPDISCITNIHAAHLEGLGSIEGVARAKAELFAATRSSGTLIVNLDDPWVCSIIKPFAHNRLTFALCAEHSPEKPDFSASDIQVDPAGIITFTLHFRQQAVAVHLFTAGEHNVGNALAAAAICSAAGAGLNEITAGLGDYRAPAKRMEILRSRFGFTILNDTYNANPASMAAGLKTLRQMAGGRAVAILGDMRELGEASAQAHFAIGSLLGELAIDEVGIVGDFKHDMERGALAAGLAAERVHTFSAKEEAVAWIKELATANRVGKDDLILVKASRGLRFETIVAEFTEGDGH